MIDFKAYLALKNQFHSHTEFCNRTFPELLLLPEEFSRCWFFSPLYPERLSFDRELDVDEVRGDRFLRPPPSCEDISIPVD